MVKAFANILNHLEEIAIAYIDFAGGIGVNNIGYCDEEVVKAIQDQVQN